MGDSKPMIEGLSVLFLISVLVFGIPYFVASREAAEHLAKKYPQIWQKLGSPKRLDGSVLAYMRSEEFRRLDDKVLIRRVRLVQSIQVAFFVVFMVIAVAVLLLYSVR